MYVFELTILRVVRHCDLGMSGALCDTWSFTVFFRDTAVQIDLNSPDGLTPEAVRQLLASASDDVHNQLRVTKGGIAYLSTVTGGQDIDGLLFRLETWAKASGYVGNVAASDEVWVIQIFNALKDNWPNPSDDYIDVY